MRYTAKIMIIVVITGLVGCSIPDADVAAIKLACEEISAVAAGFAVSFSMDQQVETDQQVEAGGDVSQKVSQNEPVTGWILAVGATLVPLSLVMYAAWKRTSSYRWLSGIGKP